MSFPALLSISAKEVRGGCAKIKCMLFCNACLEESDDEIEEDIEEIPDAHQDNGEKGSEDEKDEDVETEEPSPTQDMPTSTEDTSKDTVRRRIQPIPLVV